MPVVEIKEPSIHCDVVDAIIRKQFFTDLDNADDASLLVKMAEVFTPVTRGYGQGVN